MDALVELSADDRLELRIAAAAARCKSAPSPVAMRARFNAMRDLIAQRSPEQVRRMELAMGLVRPGPADRAASE